MKPLDIERMMKLTPSNLQSVRNNVSDDIAKSMLDLVLNPNPDIHSTKLADTLISTVLKKYFG